MNVLERSGPAGPEAGRDRALLRVRDLAVRFAFTKGMVFRKQVAEVRAVNGVTFHINRGETLGLVGESGCGKSTTGRAIVGLNRATSGSIKLEERELVGLREADRKSVCRRVQMIFQDPYSSLNPRMTVRTIVGEPLAVHKIGTAGKHRERVRELLHLVGLPAASLDRYPHQFSGGQRQRIGIARALATNPDLVIADEPISALDVSIQAQILNLLKRLQDELGLTYLFIAHDLAAVRHISDRMLVMFLGQIMETAPTSKIYRSPLHPYTVALLSAVPIPDPRIEEKRSRVILRGEVPSPINPPSGCKFHTRCWLREKLGNPVECEEQEPKLREALAQRWVACHFSKHVPGSSEQRQALGSAGEV